MSHTGNSNAALVSSAHDHDSKWVTGNKIKKKTIHFAQLSSNSYMHGWNINIHLLFTKFFLTFSGNAVWEDFTNPFCQRRQCMLILRLKEMPSIVAMVTIFWRKDR